MAAIVVGNQVTLSDEYEVTEKRICESLRVEPQESVLPIQ
jgi:hypothetical protein